MTNIQMRNKIPFDARRAHVADMKLEVVVIPVSDVDRTKQFYSDLGWRLDMDVSRGEPYRVIQFTPPGSQCSIVFGQGITYRGPGSAKGLHLIVSDIEAARTALMEHGVAVSEIFHDATGVFHHADGKDRLSGPAPMHRSYGSYATFSDPDGNSWVFQEVTERLPGHVSSDVTTFASPIELARALRRAEIAHAMLLDKQVPEWADWYADYIFREQTGKQLPSREVTQAAS